MSRKGAIIILLVITIAITGAFGYVLSTLVHFNVIKDTGIKTDATVTVVTGVRRNKRGTTSQGIAVYYDEEGYEHEYEGTLGVGIVDVGDKITVTYNKDNPDEVIKLDDEIWLWIGTAALGCFSVGLIFSCIWVLTHRVDKKRISCVHQNVTDEELVRVIREYMPQTREKYAREKKKNRSIDKVTADEYVEGMLRSGDELIKIYNNFKSIAENGNVYLGAIIRPLDSSIFNELSDNSNQRFTTPAYVVYSTDDWFTEHPQELISISQGLCGSLYGGQFNSSDAQLINALNSNTFRPFNLEYCGLLSHGRKIYISTVMLSKFQLCNQKLCNRLMYIVANPSVTPYASILPAWYWSLWELSAF